MAASSVEAREHAQNLIAKKDEMEAEIKALFEVLESQSGVGMTGPLIDEEGYPRNDIDVYSVRTARHEIICLEIELHALMEKKGEAQLALDRIVGQRRE